jgi:tetratricopeptide (TPR) repeat protein
MRTYGLIRLGVEVRHSAWKWIVLTIAGLAVTAGAATGTAAGMPSAAQAAERLGTVSFPNSCAPSVQPGINRGVALLHDFWYSESGPQFERILKADPSCAIAHWGIAMSAFHQIWDRPDESTLAEGWKQMQAAQARPAKSAREREYIAVLSDFFRPGSNGYEPRIRAYAEGMGRLYAHYPDDVDAGAFYALALLAASQPNDTTLTQQHEAMAVLTPLWHKYPDHPGLVHYIIHACDTPALAPDGLAAARHYGEIAASGPHAAHMPGHIFARLGMWQEDITSNLASVEASKMAEARHENGWMDQFHSDDFLVYAYLQSAQEAQAKAVVAAATATISHYESMPGMAPDSYMVGMFPYFRMKLPLFVALETRDWKSAAALDAANAGTYEAKLLAYWARTIASGHLHQAQQARANLAAYDAVMTDLKKGDRAWEANGTSAKINRGVMLAWVAFAAGNVADAVRQMRASADLQDKVGQGEVDIPAREMLGDVLLESGKPKEALAEYKQSLELSPNRFNTLFYAGRAAEAAGDPGQARSYYAALLKSTDNGSRSARAEIGHAKAFVATASLAR